MLFTIKKPKSQRFFQISFKGFIPRGKNFFEKFFFAWREFLALFRWYLIKKLGLLFYYIFKAIYFLFKFPNKVKNFTIKKMIWSRGRLGRSIATLIIMTTFLIVFIFGEVLSGSSLVIDKAVKPDYLATNLDIIPTMALAKTTIPKERKDNESFSYTVVQGDTLSLIGNKFKISVDALKYVNGLTDYSTLSIGQEITIPPIAGLIHKVEKGDTLNSIANRYKVPAQAVADFNYILDTSNLALGTELVIPGGEVPKQVFLSRSPSQAIGRGSDFNVPVDKNYCVWPSTVKIITQYFSWYHNGVDIATPLSDGLPPLLACSGGRVVRAGWDPWGLGLHVQIDHGDGFKTIYGHMSRLDVSYGQDIRRGQIIGIMGNTGRSTGPHVHFMIEYNGVAQNPLNYTQ